jgi:branched-chain amino acid transport system substrate-binding protein
MHGVFTAEALRTAMRHFGHQPLTGAQVQWGLEHLTLTPAYLMQWTAITDWIATDQALVRPLVEASAAKYAQEKAITPRTCP